MSATSPAFTVLSDAGSCGVRGKEKISAEDSDIVEISRMNEKHISDVLNLLDDDMTNEANAFPATALIAHLFSAIHTVDT